jgi:hypothetical protein
MWKINLIRKGIDGGHKTVFLVVSTINHIGKLSLIACAKQYYILTTYFIVIFIIIFKFRAIKQSM